MKTLDNRGIDPMGIGGKTTLLGVTVVPTQSILPQGCKDAEFVVVCSMQAEIDAGKLPTHTPRQPHVFDQLCLCVATRRRADNEIPYGVLIDGHS